MEAIPYIEVNEHGSVVVVGTRIHVDAIGFAHEDGSSEQELLGWFSLNKEQLYGALAYFYGHRDELIANEKEAAKLAEELSRTNLDKLREWRKKKST